MRDKQHYVRHTKYPYPYKQTHTDTHLSSYMLSSHCYAAHVEGVFVHLVHSSPGIGMWNPRLIIFMLTQVPVLPTNFSPFCVCVCMYVCTYVRARVCVRVCVCVWMRLGISLWLWMNDRTKMREVCNESGKKGGTNRRSNESMDIHSGGRSENSQGL